MAQRVRVSTAPATTVTLRECRPRSVPHTCVECCAVRKPFQRAAVYRLAPQPPAPVGPYRAIDLHRAVEEMTDRLASCPGGERRKISEPAGEERDRATGTW
jgi:hypothetical protein